MGILDDMGLSKLSAKVFSKVNYSFKNSNVPFHVTATESEYTIVLLKKHSLLLLLMWKTVVVLNIIVKNVNFDE